jgi:hypothetical protein
MGAVLFPLIAMAVVSGSIGCVRDVSAIRAKLYSQPTEQPETPAV